MLDANFNGSSGRSVPGLNSGGYEGLRFGKMEIAHGRFYRVANLGLCRKSWVWKIRLTVFSFTLQQKLATLWRLRALVHRKNCEIRHSAFLRKGSWICEDSVVGHSSEIKNSILLPGSKAPHFNYVGDSILGFGVNLGAGTKLSNVRNDRGLVKVTMRDGSKVETGLKKMGSLIGNYAQLGCNVVTNPGSILEPMVMVSPNVTVSGWLEARS